MRTDEQPVPGKPHKWSVGQKILGKGYIICIWRLQKKQLCASQSGLSSNQADLWRYLVKLFLCLSHGYKM